MRLVTPDGGVQGVGVLPPPMVTEFAKGMITLFGLVNMSVVTYIALGSSKGMDITALFVPNTTVELYVTPSF